MAFKIILLLLFFSKLALSYSFREAVKSIEEHPAIYQTLSEANSLEGEGREKGSWGDPEVGIKARNLPIETNGESFPLDASPMSGIEYSLAQKFALSNKYSKVQNSFKLSAKAKRLDSVRQKKSMVATLWNLAILKRRYLKDREIYQENSVFLADMLKITNRLYVNGKVGQQAVLELQIRKSELDAELSNIKHQLAQVERSLAYFVKGGSGELDLDTVPWSLVDRKSKAQYGPDERELSLESQLEASDLALGASKLNYIPDLKLSLSYIERDSSVDDFGHFMSAGVFFTLPLSSQKYGASDGAVAKKLKAQNELKDYRLKRTSELGNTQIDIQKIKAELEILNSKTAPFASASRQVTSKSYGLGKASYIELNQAWLRLQKILLKRNALEAELTMKKVGHLFLRGDELYEK